MKNIVLVLIVLSLLAVPAVAQTTANPGIKAYAVLGKGIAASTSDPMDFMIVKFGLGRVVTTNSTETVLGVMIADDVKYRLKEIVIEEGHASGKIFNEEEVGSFDVSSVMKGDTEIWAGTMELDDKDYNVYVIEGVRPIKAGELKDKVADYCRENEDANCTSKIHEYCENNPEDSRCKALFRAYCLKGNMEDTSCRESLREWCKNNPVNKVCIPMELNWAKNYCEEQSDSVLCQRIANATANLCSQNPDNEGCITIKQLLKERPGLLAKAATLRNRIANIRSEKIQAGLHAGVQTESNETGGE